MGGTAVDVAERMNILAQLQEARIRLQGMTLLDSAGRRVARVDIDAPRSSIVPKDMEIARGDLARILHRLSGAQSRPRCFVNGGLSHEVACNRSGGRNLPLRNRHAMLAGR